LGRFLIVEEILHNRRSDVASSPAKNDPGKSAGSGDDLLHSGRLGHVFSASAAKYTSSIDFDGRLVRAVLQINAAHAIMLARQGIVDEETAAKLVEALSKIPEDMKLNEMLEDVHMNVEDKVISLAGRQVGGMLNLAKSRNDQVATALRMALREELLGLGGSMVRLQEALLAQASAHAGDAMPGYTHLQKAQPVTLGHHLLAHFDALDRDFARLVDCYRRVNNSPMGAGALAGTGFRIDRAFVARLLGFDSLVENSLDAVSSRDFATESIYLCAQTLADLSRISEEVILWTSSEFSFAEVADEFASTSSMMPQKKNAIVPEIGRAKASQVLGDLVGALGIVNSLPLSYNLDLQELTRNLWSAVEKARISFELHAEMMRTIRFHTDEMMRSTSREDFLFATELADRLVEKYGVSFRDAHGRVATLARLASQRGEARFANLGEKKIQEILGVPITTVELSELTRPETVLSRRTGVGFPSQTAVVKACKVRSGRVESHRRALEALASKIASSRQDLENNARRIGVNNASLARQERMSTSSSSKRRRTKRISSNDDDRAEGRKKGMTDRRTNRRTDRTHRS
jgi:argininosuccinate lyase